MGKRSYPFYTSTVSLRVSSLFFVSRLSSFLLLLLLPYIVVDGRYSIALMSDLHIGEGCLPVPYNGTDDCYSVQYLRQAIDYLNTKLVPMYNLSYLFISGDLTSSSYPTQWMKVREILDSMHVNYIPAIGNHDIWPYDQENGTYESPYPNGDAFFFQTFADIFEKHREIITDYTANTTVYNPRHNCTSMFQNWEAFIVDPDTNSKALWLAPDFNTRDHAWDPNERGSMGYVESLLSNFTGGVLPWLASRLEYYSLLPVSEQPDIIYLFHHQPYKCPIYVPDVLFCFGVQDKIVLQETLLRYFPPEKYWGGFTGHTHIYTGPERPFLNWPTFKQFETSASKGDALFPENVTSSITIVTLDGPISAPVAIIEHYRNSVTGLWTIVNATL